MILKYTNSQGKEFDLLSSRLCRIKDANFHKYNWGYEGVSKQYGINVSRFTKAPYEYETTLVFKGSERERADALNALHEAAAHDVLNKTPGILQWGGYQLECYIISTDTYPDETNNRTLNEIVLFAPYPFWVKIFNKEFFRQEREESEATLGFAFDFPFDFVKEEAGNVNINVDHYTSSHFEMTIHGPCENPRIFVNDYPYQIHTELLSGEHLVIDSRKHSVTKHLIDGKTEDIYNSRNFEHSVFEKIPSGQLRFVWTGSFGFSLVLFLERSEPKW